MEKIRKPSTTLTNGGEIDPAASTKVAAWSTDSKLADSSGRGLLSNQIAPTALTSADLTSQTNCTIDSGDVNQCKYSMTNSMVTLITALNTITITGAVASFSFTLPVTVPRPAFQTTAIGEVYDNSASAAVVADINITATGVVTVSKSAGGTFTGGTNTNYLRFQAAWFII